uniref:Ig-like domain-containing protein n=1 Tax=Anopheles maculatus TaxID=74869 RepID=A0A182TC26_9DIPT
MSATGTNKCNEASNRSSECRTALILFPNFAGQFSRSQSVDIDEPHTYTPPKHYFQTSSFDETELEDDAAKNPLDRGPYFDISASRNVTALVGNTAYLNCRVRNLGNRTVSWIRHRDLHLLTVGKATYTSDQRYQSVHNPQLDDWSLKVSQTSAQDGVGGFLWSPSSQVCFRPALASPFPKSSPTNTQRSLLFMIMSLISYLTA